MSEHPHVKERLNSEAILLQKTQCSKCGSEINWCSCCGNPISYGRVECDEGHRCPDCIKKAVERGIA